MITPLLSQAAVGQRLREDSLRELQRGRPGLTRDGHVEQERRPTNEGLPQQLAFHSKCRTKRTKKREGKNNNEGF
ncbi:hypothetical protein QQF64_005055 [Cirrhinus molitorella]|uniref:Uncharacterized protein n=1 Tax=Cirrhinus molitorella TaxID=172907 RepID=A0ABR3MJB7_9TELE